MKTDSLKSLKSHCRQQAELIDELIRKNNELTRKNKILEENANFWKDGYIFSRKNFSWNVKYSAWIMESCSGELWKVPKAAKIPLELVFDLPIMN